jgi:hypothetical protein
MRRILGTLLLVLAVASASGQSGDDEVEATRRAIERIRNSAEHRWEQIPWVPTLTEALEQSKREKLPVFLFTLDGNMRSGRC